MKSFEKKPPKWNSNEIIEEIKNFLEIYENRPIKNNKNGMRFPHMFATYFILKKIKPSFVVESGVFKGQSTWLIENTLPNADILSIDIDLNQREYVSKKVTYSDIDFKYQNFSKIPSDALVFFDDHVNHYERLMQSKFFNIKNIILEDNYPVKEGDFYSLKHSYNNDGFIHNYSKISLVKTFGVFLNEILKKIYFKNYIFKLDKIKSRLRDHPFNINDFKNIEKNLEIYFEFPNISKLVDNNLKLSDEEFSSYNYITYIKLH